MLSGLSILLSPAVGSKLLAGVSITHLLVTELAAEKTQTCKTHSQCTNVIRSHPLQPYCIHLTSFLWFVILIWHCSFTVYCQHKLKNCQQGKASYVRVPTRMLFIIPSVLLFWGCLQVFQLLLLSLDVWRVLGTMIEPEWCRFHCSN